MMMYVFKYIYVSNFIHCNTNVRRYPTYVFRLINSYTGLKMVFEPNTMAWLNIIVLRALVCVGLFYSHIVLTQLYTQLCNRNLIQHYLMKDSNMCVHLHTVLSLFHMTTSQIADIVTMHVKSMMKILPTALKLT